MKTRRAYSVRWKDSPRWDIKAAKATLFRLAHPGFRPLGDFAEEATESVRPMDDPEHEWPVYGVNNTSGIFLSQYQKGNKFNAPYKRIRRDWFFHNPTRANIGSLGRVPDVPDDAITSPEYQVWRLRKGLLPEFVEILIKTRFFLDQIDCHRVGAVKERLFVGNLLEIPVPNVSERAQRAIVSAWDQAQAGVADIHQRVAELEDQVEIDFLADLGLTKPQRAKPPKVFAVWWHKLERWSVMFHQLSNAKVGISSGKYPVVALKECLEGTSNGYCIRPVSRETPHRMLRLNALQPWGLDVGQAKFVKVSDEIAWRFHIRQGDLLICRSVGSFDHVAKCALVEEDRPDILFPDIIIRARFNDRIKPRYAREFIQSSAGRTWFQQNARTAVGMWKIGGSDIAELPIPLPPLSVQSQIVEKVTAQREKISVMKADARLKTEQATVEVEAMILGQKSSSA